MDSHQPVVLVTGAGSGFGLETALLLAERGWHVFGSVLTAAEGEALATAAAGRGVAIESVHMDVTKPEQTQAAVKELVARAGRIDACVQFAGMGLRGFLEDVSLDEIRKVYEVNVFGGLNICQAVLPYMRAQRAGRIVITSSAAGKMPSLGIGGYSSSKFAVEGMAECLRQEVMPFNIWVSLLAPGLVQTPHFTVNRNRARKAVDPSSPYYLWFCQHEKIVDDLLASNKFTVRDIAETTYGILTARKPRLRYMVGFKAKLLTALHRYVPGTLFERIYWPTVRRLVTRPKVQASGLSGLEHCGKGQASKS